MRSANYPGEYPYSMEKTETLKVEQGLTLLLQFTSFNLEPAPNCINDYLTITDGDEKTLLARSCGPGYYDQNIIVGNSMTAGPLPMPIQSSSSLVNIKFSSDGSSSFPGWSLSWAAVTPGCLFLCKLQRCNVKYSTVPIMEIENDKHHFCQSAA